MRRIPLIKPDLPDFESVEARFREVLENGRVTNFGKYVCMLEEKVGEYIGAGAVSVSSGTAGLILALQSVGLKPGQKVVLPSFTFVASAQAVLYAGGIPVFADIGEDMTMSSSDLADILRKQPDVGAVMPVHTYGLPCRVKEIEQVVEEAAFNRSHTIPVIYDAAHAFGSSSNGHRVGSFGTAEVFSLSVTKTLTAAEGGLVTSRDSDFIGRVRKMRNYGIHDNYNALWPGINGKMSEFHAIIALQGLARLDDILTTRNQKAQYYMKQIKERTHFEIIPCSADVTHTYKDFTVLIPHSLSGRREEIMGFLKDAGIETRAYFYPPIHQQDYFRTFADRSLPYTEAVCGRVLTLPFYTSIEDSDIDYVVENLASAEKKISSTHMEAASK